MLSSPYTWVLLLLFSTPAARAQDRTYWSVEQSMKMKNVTAVRPSPDGKRSVYTVREALMTDDRSEYVAQIYLAEPGSAAPRRLSRGDRNNTNPRWSPDGRAIAFLSNRDGKTNLYLLPVEGGESERLTDVKTGVQDFRWRPDGKAIAYTMTDAPSDAEAKNKKAGADWYFMDESYKQGRIHVLWLNEKDTTGRQKTLQLTADNRHISSFDWSPDGNTIVYTHAASPGVNDNAYSDIALVEVASGKLRDIARTPAGEGSPRFSPDGKHIAYVASDEGGVWAGASTVRIVPASGGKPLTLAATPNEGGTLLGWSADGGSVYLYEPWHTTARIYRLPADGRPATEWSPGSADLITAPELNDRGTHLGFVLQNPGKPGDAYTSALSSFAPQRLSRVNPEIEKYPVPKTEVISWTADDGKTIEGLLTYPLHYEKGKRYPLLLNIHGGPAGVFNQAFIAGNSGAYPIAAFAEKGMFVLRPNPRGSTGYGTGFRLANRRDWGGKDYEDLMRGVDHVIGMGSIDTARMGVMGWSYGGFMSSWVVGHTDRFKAASIGAPVVDLASQNMTDDIGGFLPSYMQKQPWEDWDVYSAHSPLRYVQNVKTPVLLQHGEADIRVPFSQGVMFYNALKRRGVPVRFLVLPRQPHGPTEPRMSMKVMETNLDWMSHHLMGAPRAF